MTLSSSVNVYRLFLPGLALCAASACTDPGGPLESGPTRVRIESDAGDPVGAGRSYEYTAENAVISLDRWKGNVVSLTITANERWGILLMPPDNIGQLVPGSYEASRTYQGSTYPTWIAIDKDSTRNTCLQSAGRFTIVRVEHAPDSKVEYLPYGVLAAVDATFEQRCTGATGSLRGTIHWRAE